MLLRPLRLPLLALATGLSLGLGTGPWAWGPSALAQAQEGAEISPALSVEQARAAANRILKAVKSRDANLRYSQFSDELKAVSSPAMVASTMRTQPRLLNWTLLSVQGGLRDTTVEASLTTSRGQQDLFIVLNGEGKLSGYHLDLSDEAPSLVARKFVTALSNGHFISARSFLSLSLQREIGADRLQMRWQQLQRQTGSLVRIRKTVVAEGTGDERLVLVNTEFNRLSDSLYVILNASNEITGIDFPSEPIGPQPVR
ncbi:DUF3887 domain-containing protein [Cyanobium sp. Alchichica 3B3-8F6]|uniref:DUF3887 domain-containing protein n=1 Tax=Cyanobium sp. Alchichica 3B3-8F6 TaxID=2823696 RepID=UPI0020CFD660|nr:DUF3887 domain-containing protein [Cyanobium sp. Alchichica 3B3-8F6]MCP9882546.1 DUF3887 domain-containing protein [Cyanobium sp. Alchichica 3B3-8F6]